MNWYCIQFNSETKVRGEKSIRYYGVMLMLIRRLRRVMFGGMVQGGGSKGGVGWRCKTGEYITQSGDAHCKLRTDWSDAGVEKLLDPGGGKGKVLMVACRALFGLSTVRIFTLCRQSPKDIKGIANFTTNKQESKVVKQIWL